MKKTRSLLLLSLLLLLPGCSKSTPEPPPEVPPVNITVPEPSQSTTPDTSLPERFSLPYDPALTLDPLTCPDGSQQVIGALLYEGLFALDTELQPQNVLCASFSCDETKTQWTFDLQEDIQFSDGSLLRAADVAATLNRARETDRYRARLACVESITGSGDTVTVTLSTPNAGFPALLDIPIVKAGTESASIPIGTGPYRFVSDSDGNMLVATESKRHTLPLEQIYLTDATGSANLQHRFASHQIQLLTTDLTAQNAYSPLPGTQLWDADTLTLQFIGFNTANPLFSAAELRHALGLGIDRETLVSAHLAGHALAAQSPISPHSPLYPATLDTPYSKSAFQDAMENAGYNTGNPQEVTLLVNSDNPFKVDATRYIAGLLSVCDLKITVTALPWNEYLTALETGAFDLYYGEVRLTADWNLAPLLATGGTMNYGGYQNEATDFMLQQFARSEQTADSVRRLCRYLQAQAPILPLCFKRTTVLTESGVVAGLMPTASNPFYGWNSATIHLAQNAVNIK